MILALLLLDLSQSTPLRDLLSPEHVIERVSRCGLGRPGYRYDEEAQTGVIVVRGGRRASDAQLACVDKAAPFFEVRSSPALQGRFNAIRDARLEAYFKGQGRAWLSAHGLIDRLPEYRRGDDAAFARALERLCGPEASGAFHAVNGGYSFNPEWLRRQGPRRFEEGAGACLTYAMMASGFPLGLVGNEAKP